MRTGWFHLFRQRNATQAYCIVWYIFLDVPLSSVHAETQTLLLFLPGDFPNPTPLRSGWDEKSQVLVLGIELRPAAPHPRVSTELTQVIHCHLENPPIFRWYKKTQVKSVDLWMRINVNHTLPLRKEKISYSQTLLTSTSIYVSRWNRGGATFVIIGSADPDKF
jgi:hypothetical protein